MVTINIYDSKGALVKKVQNRTMNKGEQQINVDGLEWTKGLYFCELIINNQRIVRKMVLQK